MRVIYLKSIRYYISRGGVHEVHYRTLSNPSEHPTRIGYRRDGSLWGVAYMQNGQLHRFGGPALLVFDHQKQHIECYCSLRGYKVGQTLLTCESV